MELSQNRADSVRDYLVENGVPADRLTTKAFGPNEPMESNDTKEGRQANRRCELILVPSAEEMLDLKDIAN